MEGLNEMGGGSVKIMRSEFKGGIGESRQTVRFDMNDAILILEQPLHQQELTTRYHQPISII